MKQNKKLNTIAGGPLLAAGVFSLSFNLNTFKSRRKHCSNIHHPVRDPYSLNARVKNAGNTRHRHMYILQSESVLTLQSFLFLYYLLGHLIFRLHRSVFPKLGRSIMLCAVNAEW